MFCHLNNIPQYVFLEQGNSQVSLQYEHKYTKIVMHTYTVSVSVIVLPLILFIKHSTPVSVPISDVKYRYR